MLKKSLIITVLLNAAICNAAPAVQSSIAPITGIYTSTILVNDAIKFESTQRFTNESSVVIKANKSLINCNVIIIMDPQQDTSRTLTQEECKKVNEAAILYNNSYWIKDVLLPEKQLKN